MEKDTIMVKYKVEEAKMGKILRKCPKRANLISIFPN